MTRVRSFLLATFLLCVPAATAAAQNLLTNGNFETAPTQADPVPGWDQSGAVGVYQTDSNGEYCCGLGGAVPEGTYAATFWGGGGSVGTLAQTFSTTSGSPYDVRFLLARAGGSQDNGLTGQVFDATTNAPLTSLLTFDDDAGGTFEQEAFSFTATSASTRLELASTPSGCCTDLLVDDVRVTVVPEPSAALVGLSVAAFALHTARRRR